MFDGLTATTEVQSADERGAVPQVTCHAVSFAWVLGNMPKMVGLLI